MTKYTECNLEYQVPYFWCDFHKRMELLITCAEFQKMKEKVLAS